MKSKKLNRDTRMLLVLSRTCNVNTVTQWDLELELFILVPIQLFCTLNECVKRCQIYFIGLKKTCLGVLERGERDQDNETGLKEGSVIEMSNYSAFHIRDCTRSSLKILTYCIA